MQKFTNLQHYYKDDLEDSFATECLHFLDFVKKDGTKDYHSQIRMQNFVL